MKKGTVAYYLRLSRTDGDLGKDGKNESNSIESQRKLLEDYQSRRSDLGGNARLHHGTEEYYCQHREYVDDGYSGSNFDRPGFQKLLEDCRKGLVSVILVKDMSRLGRNYIDVGDYVEQIFPMLGVRFIAVSEGFDTGVSDSTDFGIAVENMVNTFYVKDYAKKSRSARRVLWKEGVLTSKRTPLGYVCDDIKEGWKIDPGGAEIIRTIFSEAVKGQTTGMIADTLNKRGIPTPHRYLKSIGQWAGTGKTKAPEEELLWNASMVSRIVRNETYTGTLFQGKRDTVMYGDKSTRKVSQEDQYITKNAHEAIISSETFQQAQTVIRRKSAGSPNNDSGYALKGVVKCGNCRRLLLRENGAYGATMHCRSRTLAASKCSRDDYSYEELENVALAAIQQMGNLCGNILKKFEEQGNTYDPEIDRKRIRQIKARKVRSYEEYTDGIMTREQFLKEKAELAEELKELEARTAKGEAEEEHRQDVMGKLESIQRAGEISTLTREAVKELIDSIYVFGKDRIEVIFRFQDMLQEVDVIRSTNI